MSDNLDDDLPPPGLDLAGYFHVLAARLGRVPTLGEVAAFRHDVCAERLRRIRRRKAAKKPAKGLQPAPRGRGEADDVKEFFTSFEWACAVSLMLSLVVSLAELSSLRVQGRRITVRKADMEAAAEAVALANDDGDPEKLGLPPHPLGSFTPNALMLQFKATEEHRASRRAALYGDAHYPSAVASLLRANGAPIGLVEGRNAWDIVEAADPAACAFLRTLGNDPDNWKPLKLEVQAARKTALEAARRVANPEPGDPEPRPGYLDHLMQLGSPAGAAAYCSRQSWRGKGVTAAAAAAVADIELEPEPTDEPAKEPTHG